MFYTDGGSRYVKLERNVSYDNPVGITYFGPNAPENDPLPYPPYSLGNGLPYGSDIGGCITYGDIHYVENYWVSSQQNFSSFNSLYITLIGRAPYNYGGFFTVCPGTINGVTHPINIEYKRNKTGIALEDVPLEILLNAGAHLRPASIPPSMWVLP